MATSKGQVTKIYQLKTLGYSELSKELDNVAKKFDAIKRAKLSTEGKMAAAQDIADIKKYADEISKLKIEEQELRNEREKIITQQKAMNLARQVEQQQKREEQKSNQALAGSYTALYKEYRELYNLVKNTPQGSSLNFRGQNLGFDEAIGKLKQLATAEQDFRRQFARDGLLVAEYTTGIVQAFKNMGLGDLVGSQVQKANERLQQLNQQFDILQKELTEVKATGQGSMDALEKEFIENRKEAIALQQQVGILQRELKGTGDVGTRLTNSLKSGFDSLKGQVSSFALQFVGIQAAFSKLTSEVSEGFADAKQIEGVEAAFQRLNSPNLLDNLRASTRGTVSDLELMKQAVIANNFQIPMEQLGSLLDFARRRAKETGQEVDYLVQSIITGIGRKSPLILDNLGISAVRLRDNLKGVGAESATVGDVATAVAKIIQEENAKAGTEVETLSERISQNEASWRNIRIELAGQLLPALVTLGSIFLGLITNLPIFLGLLGILAAGWAVQNTQLVILNAQMLLLNARILLNYAAIGLLSAASVAYNAVLFILNGGLKIVTVALRAFGIAITTSTGPLGILLTIVALLGSALLGLSKALGSSIDNLKKNNAEIRISAEIYKRMNESTSQTISQIQTLTKVAKDHNVSLAGRKKALEDLIAIAPDYLKGLTLENLNTAEGTKLIGEYVKALREKASLQAAMAVRDEKLREDARLNTLELNLERKISTGEASDLEDLTEEEQEYLSRARKEFAFTTSLADVFRGTSAAKEALKAIRAQRSLIGQELEATDKLISEKYNQQGQTIAKGPEVNYEVDIAKLKADIEALDKQINEFKGSNADLQKLIAQRKKLQEDLDKLLGNNRNTTDTTKTKLKNSDPFMLIDADRDKRLAEEEKRRLNDEIKENEYLQNILKINQDAIDRKLDLIKGRNAEELKVRSQLQLEREKLEKDTNEKLRAIAQKQFDDLVADLQRQRDELIRSANETAEIVGDTPGATETEKAEARLEADKKILDATQTYARQLDLIERQIGFTSLKNTQDAANAVREAKQGALESERELAEASLQDLQETGAKSVAEFRAIIATQRAAIQSSDASPRRKDLALANLDREENVGILARELSSMQQQLPRYKQLLKEKQITDSAYLDFIAKLKDKESELSEALADSSDEAIRRVQSAGELLQGGIGDLFNIEEGSALDEAVGAAIAETYSLATDAMNNYFDAERERVQASMELAIEKLELERDQMSVLAQSRAEQESIDKQFAAKKKAAEMEAFEKNKDIKKKEAKIAFLVELANIWMSAMQLGPVAGPIMGGILSAIAGVRYAMNVNAINAMKYEYGGQVPTRGGKFGGRPHSQGGTPFSYQGRSFEAEVEELSIIRTKNAPSNKVYSITGNHTQIASALNQLGGGIGFAQGAKVSRFEFGGNLGESLQAPVFVPSVSNTLISSGTGITREDLNEFYSKMDNIAMEQSRRIDRLQVIQDTNTVTKAQNKMIKQSEVGTL